MTAYLKRLQFESIESFTENPTAYIQRVEVVEVVDIYGNPIPIGPPTPPGPIPSLDLPFAETESLIDVISNTNLITFSRSSNGTYVGSDRLVKDSPANDPRFDHDPTTGESLGLLIENPSTNLQPYSQEFDQTVWSKGNSTITPNATVAPDGTVTADEWVGNATGRLSDELTLADATYTVSFYVKPVTTQTVFRTNVLGRNPNTNETRVEWDLINQTATIQQGSGPAEITPFANGWFRCSLTYVKTGGSTTLEFRPLDNNNVPDITGLYIWGAQCEEQEAATSYIPTTASTVTRAPDIVEIKGANFQTQNLLEYSQYFTASSWSNEIGNQTVIPNVEVSPNGTTTASKLIVTNSTIARERKLWQLVDVEIGEAYTFSLYIKAVPGQINTGSLDITLGNNDNIDVSQTFTATNQWQRISVTTQSAGAALIRCYITGDATAQLYIWGAQFEPGSAATTYMPSTVTFVSRASTGTYVDDTTGLIETAAVDVARYQDDELLLEDAATNVVPYSEDFTQWNVFGSLSRSVDGTLAPDNTATATKLLCTGTTKSVVFFPNIPTGDQARSFYAKAGSTPYIFMDSPATSAGVWFDLSTGTVQGTGGSMVQLANGWYRCTVATTFFSTPNYSIGPSNAMGTDATTNGQYLYLWGAQVEAGNYSTSYIPTTGSTATRAADVSTSAASVPSSSWYNQDEGSVFVEAAPYTDQPQRTFTNFRDTADVNKRQRLATNQLFFNLGDVNIPLTPMAGNQKLAYGVDVDNVALYRDGVVVGGDSSFTLNPANEFQIGKIDNQATRYLNGHMKRVAYYDTKLPNSTLQELTSEL